MKVQNDRLYFPSSISLSQVTYLLKKNKRDDVYWSKLETELETTLVHIGWLIIKRAHVLKATHKLAKENHK